MGVGGMRFKPGRSSYTPPMASTRPVAPNPDPWKFEIVRSFQIKKIFVSEIRYEGCTTFEGRKILVTSWDPATKSHIDPHFTAGGGLLARFEPTEDGFTHALAFGHSAAQK